MGLMLVLLGLFSAAFAQDTVDVAAVTNADVRVVQKILYPKADRAEITASVGWMPFDALLTTPNLQFGFTKHNNERFGWGAVVGGGFGLKNGRYAELESPAYGVAPDAYRYLASALAGIEWSPIYGKMTTNGARIVHYDGYANARAGVSLESSVIPSGGVALAPTLSLGVGTRIFLGNRAALRIELRDDLLIEHRKLTDNTYFKQNANVLVGWTIFTEGPGEGR